MVCTWQREMNSLPLPCNLSSVLVLPVYVHKPDAARGYGVGVVCAVFPDDRAVRFDLDELELNRRACGNARVDEPVRVVGRVHRTDGGTEGRAPVAEFDDVAGEVDVVAGAGRRGVEDGKGHGDLRRAEYREVAGVGNLRR